MTHPAPALLDTSCFDPVQARLRIAVPKGEVSFVSASPETLQWLQPILDAANLDEAALEQLVRDTGALKRPRVIRSAQQLLMLLMLYVVSDASLRDVAAYSTQMGARMSDEAVRKRFAQAEPFIKALLARMLGTTPTGLSRRVMVCDATVVSVPGSKGTNFRLHVMMELGGEHLEMKLTETRTGESLRQFTFSGGELVLCDSQYSRQKDVELVLSQGVDVLVRFRNQQWPGQPASEWVPRLTFLGAGQTTTFRLPLSCGRLVYVHAMALPEEQANEARRKRRQRTKKKTGKEPSELTLLLAGYVLLLTTLTPEEMSAEQAMALYRHRWQIELLFKRYKSLLALDHLASGKDSVLSHVKLWMKLLYACLVERASKRWQRLVGERTSCSWRAWRLAREQLRAALWLHLFRAHAPTDLIADALAERPRKRILQSRDLEVLEGLIA